MSKTVLLSDEVLDTLPPLIDMQYAHGDSLLLQFNEPILINKDLEPFYFIDIDLTVLAIELYRLTDSSVLLALPLFTFAGFLLSESKTADRLVNASQAALGWLRLLPHLPPRNHHTSSECECSATLHYQKNEK